MNNHKTLPTICIPETKLHRRRYGHRTANQICWKSSCLVRTLAGLFLSVTFTLELYLPTATVHIRAATSENIPTCTDMCAQRRFRSACAFGCNISSCGQRSIISDCAEAQASLSLLRAHMSEGTFSHIVVYMSSAITRGWVNVYSLIFFPPTPKCSKVSGTLCSQTCACFHVFHLSDNRVIFFYLAESQAFVGQFNRIRQCRKENDTQRKASVFKRHVYGPRQAKMCLRTGAKCADSDHPAHTQSNIRAFALHSYILWYPMILIQDNEDNNPTWTDMCAQWRFWSDCTIAQSDQNLHRANFRGPYTCVEGNW